MNIEQTEQIIKLAIETIKRPVKTVLRSLELQNNIKELYSMTSRAQDAIIEEKKVTKHYKDANKALEKEICRLHLIISYLLLLVVSPLPETSERTCTITKEDVEGLGYHKIDLGNMDEFPVKLVFHGRRPE